MTPSRTSTSQQLSDTELELTLRLSESQVFFDFDNTITAFDVLDGIIERFSVNRDWIAYEEAWKKGKIGSRQCLEGQLRSIRVERPQLHAFLETVSIDASFSRLLALLHRFAPEHMENGLMELERDFNRTAVLRIDIHKVSGKARKKAD